MIVLLEGQWECGEQIDGEKRNFNDELNHNSSFWWQELTKKMQGCCVGHFSHSFCSWRERIKTLFYIDRHISVKEKWRGLNRSISRSLSLITLKWDTECLPYYLRLRLKKKEALLLYGSTQTRVWSHREASSGNGLELAMAKRNDEGLKSKGKMDLKRENQ